MVSLTQLWLAILLSGVAVFLVSSILHMALPLHKGDYKKMPGEADILDTMRAQKPSPGQYMFPCPESMADAQTPEMQEKYKHGPVGYAIILPNGPISMGKNLAMWFLFTLVVSFMTAYVGSFSLKAGATFMEVFRLTGTIAIIAYSVGYIPDSIWKGLSWSITAKFMLDGLFYGLATAAVMGWLWPAA
jgi:hypothetical protein